MKLADIINQIKAIRSFLCVGLDTELMRLPTGFKSSLDDLVEFNKEIIEATKEHCVSYKVNTAFYERYGSKGWKALEKTRKLLPPTHFLIADAKRGDIGNTSSQYAEAFFSHLDFDAITATPYMGRDSISPFLDFDHKWTILLGITSNPGSADFQTSPDADGVPLYERVIKKGVHWATAENLMFVCGATQPGKLKRARELAPNHFFLVPGVGHQGGSLEEVAENCLNSTAGVLVNSSRSIIYASSGSDFQEAANQKARSMNFQMDNLLKIHQPHI